MHERTSASCAKNPTVMPVPDAFACATARALVACCTHRASCCENPMPPGMPSDMHPTRSPALVQQSNVARGTRQASELAGAVHRYDQRLDCEGRATCLHHLVAELGQVRQMRDDLRGPIRMPCASCEPARARVRSGPRSMRAAVAPDWFKRQPRAFPALIGRRMQCVARGCCMLHACMPCAPCIRL